MDQEYINMVTKTNAGIDALVSDICATSAKLDGIITWASEKSCFIMRPYYSYASSFNDTKPQEIMVSVINARGRKCFKKITYVIGTYIPKATIEATTEPMYQLNLGSTAGPIIHNMTM
jgi:hypothetical protein